MIRILPVDGHVPDLPAIVAQSEQLRIVRRHDNDTSRDIIGLEVFRGRDDIGHSTWLPADDRIHPVDVLRLVASLDEQRLALAASFKAELEAAHEQIDELNAEIDRLKATQSVPA